MKIEAASLAQVRKGRDGLQVTIYEDVLDIAKQLQEIDPRLSLSWNEYGGYFVVAETLENGDTKLVTTALACDQRLLERVRQIGSPDYDYAAELERTEKEKQREIDHRTSEQTGEIGERLAHALSDGQSKIYLPAGV